MVECSLPSSRVLLSPRKLVEPLPPQESVVGKGEHGVFEAHLSSWTFNTDDSELDSEPLPTGLATVKCKYVAHI